MAYQDSDLFGHPIPANFGGRGAPAFAASGEDVRIVMGLWAQDKSNAYCASALGISEPTFNKYFFKTKAQKAQRDKARAWIDGMALRAVLKAVDEGNMAAVKQLREIMHRSDLELLSKDIARERREEERDEAKADKPRGKKEQQLEEAQGVGGIYTPGAAPGGMVN